MSLSFGSNSTSSSQSSSATPNAITASLFNPIFGAATSDVSSPYAPYGGELYPGLTSGQLQAAGMANANLDAGQSTLNSGVGAALGLTGYDPSQVSAPVVTAAQTGPASLASATGYDPADAQAANAGPAAMTSSAAIDPSSVSNLSPGLLSDTDLTPYLDPATQDVINTTLAHSGDRCQHGAEIPAGLGADLGRAGAVRRRDLRGGVSGARDAVEPRAQTDRRVPRPRSFAGGAGRGARLRRRNPTFHRGDRRCGGQERPGCGAGCGSRRCS
jgi:hypothetical protein